MKGKPRLGRQNVWTILLNFISVIMSTLGLIILVLAYCLLGGAIFQWLEADTEMIGIMNGRTTVTATIKKYSADIYAQIHLDSANQSVEPLTSIRQILDQVADEAYDMSQNGEWDGVTENDANITLNWTFSGAVLFAVTTITTIGNLWMFNLHGSKK